MRVLTIAALVVAVVGCRSGLDTPTDLGNQDLAGRDLAVGAIKQPTNHRVDDSQCSAPRNAGTCMFQGGLGSCKADTDCTTGSNGRCEQNQGGPAGCQCSYDTCTHDTDCKTGQLCACHDSGYWAGGNTCIMGNCRVDGDCNGRGCSPSTGQMGCGGVDGYFCHTASDECINDGDCGDASHVCQFVASAGHWSCQLLLLCP